MTEPTPKNMCSNVVIPPVTGAADTYNWDTAYGITFEKVNNSIVRANSSPANFTGPYVDSFGGGSYVIAANFGAWQLSGGSGDLVHMTLPLTNGTITPGAGGNAIAFTGSASIEVKLEWLPQPGASSDKGTHHLKINLTTNDPVNSPIVSVVNMAVNPARYNNAVQSVLQTWLLANLQQFNHVFSVVDLGAQADKAGFQWLKPTKLGYAVNTEGATDPKNYVFGVLAMTEGRPGVRLGHQISPNIIPTGADAGFLISQERFLSKLLLPGMAVLFKGATAADFTLGPDGTLVQNKNALTFRTFKLEDGSKIDGATIDAQKFSLEARATSLRMSFDDFHFPWTPKGSIVPHGFVVHLTYTAESVLFLDANHHLQMCTVGNRAQKTGPTLNVVVTKTTAEKWTEIAVGVVEGIVLAVVGAMIGGALGPEVDEAAEGAEQAGQDAVEDTAGGDPLDFDADFESDNKDNNLAKNNSNEDGEASKLLDEPNRLEKLKGFFKRNWRKMLGATIGSIAAVGLGVLPQILEAYAENNLAEMPTLDKFADESIKTTTWPGATGTKLLSASLNGSLQLGIQITFNQ